LVGQTIFGDETDAPLLDATSVLAVRQSQVGSITGEATATVEATMAGERDHQINGVVGPRITEIMEGAAAHAIATGAVATARATPRWPVATVPLKARLGQLFDTCDAFGDIRDILTWTSHRFLS
jgi:hypothetical protein